MIRSGILLRDMLDDEVLGRVDPAAIVVEMGEDANGFKYGVGSDGDAVNLFDDVSQGEAQIVGAAFVERESMGVAINGALGEMVGLSDASDTVPMQEFLLYEIALGMLANGAFAFVS